jgi:hypothetical protein
MNESHAGLALLVALLVAALLVGTWVLHRLGTVHARARAAGTRPNPSPVEPP